MRILLSSANEQVLREQLKFFESVLKDSGLDIMCIQPGDKIEGDGGIVMIGRLAKKRGDLKSFVRKEQVHIYLTAAPDDISAAAQARGFTVLPIETESDKTSLLIWEVLEPLLISEREKLTHDKPSESEAAQTSAPVVKRTNYKQIDAKPARPASSLKQAPTTSQLDTFLQASLALSTTFSTTPVGIYTKLTDLFDNQTDLSKIQDLIDIKYSEDTSPYTKLISVSPANELWASAPSYYAAIEQSWALSQLSFDALPYNTKARMLEHLLVSAPDNLDVLYAFEVLGPASDLIDIASAAQNLQFQTLTPRYGYAQVDEDLHETYEKCFDQAAAHYMTIVASPNSEKAYQTCLMGHRIRYMFRITPQMVPKLKNTTIYQEVTKKIAEKHPLIADFIAQ